MGIVPPGKKEKNTAAGTGDEERRQGGTVTRVPRDSGLGAL